MKNNIKRFREDMGMTQEGLASICGCRRETIANLERGKYEPGLALADRICNALCRNAYEVFDLESGRFYGYALDDAKVAGKNAAFDAIYKTSEALISR